ncbi:MAG: bifunctional phosphoribosylaminoimidazolecarboxamide formyltransferase/IMP cyclohydrolase [Saprospiraceae bacterium]|nr:bifunctional phosphoribosylaminoimidazolecarboxamide formyltransferase/IMP cyclohydrolase [Saprospiraceae bacterium]
MDPKIKSALISVYYKDGLEHIVRKLDGLGVTIYTTGGTQSFIEGLGIKVKEVETLTGYPSILGGRVKTLHPKVFGGIMAIREDVHLAQLDAYEIPPIDLVIVDLYPFEETVSQTTNESDIIEKIDIGGISLIRAAAKNFKDVVVISSKSQYGYLLDILHKYDGFTLLADRKKLASEAFMISSHYDTAIFNYLAKEDLNDAVFKRSMLKSEPLRYGENPHQTASYFGDMSEVFDKICGKDLSYNNLVDADAAIMLMAEFKDFDPTFAIIKHTNPCGIASRSSAFEAWHSALEADPVSAFGGILICNAIIDIDTAKEIDKIFYEVLIAPDFTPDALSLLVSKPKRIVLRLKNYNIQKKGFKSLLNGVIVQDNDLLTESTENFETKTISQPSPQEMTDLIFALKCCKHLKSNTIVLAKNAQMLAMGCGQTSRIDACRHAIEKARQYGFELNGAVMASDAFFPFPDCVELVHHEGISAVIQPGGSIKDNLSIEYCNAHSMSMVFTGIRHFKH